MRKVKGFIDFMMANFIGKAGSLGLRKIEDGGFVWVGKGIYHDTTFAFLYFEYRGMEMFNHWDPTNTTKSVTRNTYYRYRDDGSISLPWSLDYEEW